MIIFKTRPAEVSEIRNGTSLSVPDLEEALDDARDLGSNHRDKVGQLAYHALRVIGSRESPHIFNRYQRSCADAPD